MTTIGLQIIQVLQLHGPLTTRGLLPYVSGGFNDIVKTVLSFKHKGLLEHADKDSVPAKWRPTAKGLAEASE